MERQDYICLTDRHTLYYECNKKTVFKSCRINQCCRVVLAVKIFYVQNLKFLKYVNKLETFRHYLEEKQERQMCMDKKKRVKITIINIMNNFNHHEPYVTSLISNS